MSIVSQLPLAPAEEGLLALAASAMDLKVFAPLAIWADLQTHAYAKALFEASGATHDDVTRAVAARLDRRRFMDGTRSYQVVMAENTLLSGFGGPDVMRDQLHHLLAALPKSGLRLGIIPAVTELPVPPGAGFVIVNDVRVDSDTYDGRATATDSAAVRRFGEAFTKLHAVAVFDDEARDLIEAALDAH